MLRALIAASAAALLSLWSASAPSFSACFDSWRILFNSVDNHFDSGPTVATSAGSNAIYVGFSNTVFNPGTPILEAVAGKLPVAKIWHPQIVTYRAEFVRSIRAMLDAHVAFQANWASPLVMAARS